MKFIRLAFAAAIALSVASGVAFGQQQNQRQNNRQQQRATTMVQSLLDAGSAQSDPTVLVFRKDVQHDLLMDLGQRNKFDNLRDRQQRDLQTARMQNRRNQAAVNDLAAAQKKETRAKIDELLTAQQRDRLVQIGLQLQGNAVLFSTDFQKKLGLSDEQKQRIAMIKSQRDQQVAELEASASQGQVVPQQLATQVQQIQTDISTAIAEVLTEDQTALLKKMQGPPFKAVNG